MSFPNLLENSEEFLRNPDCLKTQEGMTKFACSDCDFYHEGEDEHLACGAYNLLELLLEKKLVSAEQIIDAIGSNISDA
jgi:hypothetical protein